MPVQGSSWSRVAICGSVALGLTALGAGCGGDAAGATDAPDPYTVTLPSPAPLTRDEIAELKAQLASPYGDPADIVVPASVFAFDDDTPDVDAPAWRHLIEVLVAVRDSALGNGWRLVVEGYTDETGTEAYNQDLSGRRASAAKAEIVRVAGYPTSEVVATGLGEGGGTEQDRRVVVRFERKEAAP